MNFLKSLIGDSSPSVSDTRAGSALTENGAWSYKSTGSALLDLSMKTVRGLEKDKLFALLDASWKENELLTAKYIFHCRDCRGGKGERQIFRDCLVWLAVNKPFVVRKNIHLIPVYGRWDDLFVLRNPKGGDSFRSLWNLAWRLIKKQLLSDMSSETPSILAKWMPREGGSLDKKTKIVEHLCAKFKWSPRQYRKRIAQITHKLQVPEQQMCAKNWTDINYSGVPSQCMLRMRKVFARHDETGFAKFLEDVRSGAKTIKGRLLDVHQMTRSLMKSRINDPVIEAQWKEKMKTISRLDNCLAIVDTSASMTWHGGEPMEVAVAMGLVISEKAAEPFNNMLMTFSSHPTFHQVTGDSLFERIYSIRSMSVGGTTNFQAVFDLILSRAQEYNLVDEDLPRTLFVFSDMQFNEVDGQNYWGGPIHPRTNWDAIREKYNNAGYTMPTVVFWNLRANTVDFPATDENGIVMLSGYSTALLNYIIEGKTPTELLNTILNSKRYEPITLSS